MSAREDGGREQVANEMNVHADEGLQLVPEECRRRSLEAGVGATVGGALGPVLGGPVSAAIGVSLGGAVGVAVGA